MKKNKQQKGFTLLYAVLVSSIVLSASLSIINISLKQHKLSALSRESKTAFYAANTGVDCALYWETNHRQEVIEGGASSSDVKIFPAVTNDSEYDDPANSTDDDDEIDRDNTTESNKDPKNIYCLGKSIVDSAEFYGTSGDPLDQFYSFPSRKWESHATFESNDAGYDNLEEYCLDYNKATYIQNYRTWIFQVVLPESGVYSKNNACAVVSVCKNLDPIGNGGYNTIYTSKGYNTCDITKENVVERGIRLIQG